MSPHFTILKCLGLRSSSALAAFMMVASTALWCFASETKPATEDLSPFRACGLNCLFVVAKMNGVATTLDALEKEVAPRANGDSSIADLERAAGILGLESVSARLNMDALRTTPLPAILHLKTRARQSDSSHYVVRSRSRARTLCSVGS